ncbi:RNA polymerase sigma factor [Pseudoxanthomonas wuyuanensis]|nr:sigma-70 family RNA polymerase sigma factor [Pseudoxanthomonas wuyuanensis]
MIFDRQGPSGGESGSEGSAMDDLARTRWFMQRVLPHEPALRAWLGRRHAPAFDVDDLIQESYAILAEREDLDDILNPRAYLFQVAQSLVVRNIRRAQVVSIHSIEDLGQVEFADEGATPERAALDRDELRRLASLISAMPGQAREAFVLRRVHDLPQREIAERMGLAESTVEKHIARGIRWLGEWMASGGSLPVQTSRGMEREKQRADERTRN